MSWDGVWPGSWFGGWVGEDGAGPPPMTPGEWLIRARRRRRR